MAVAESTSVAAFGSGLIAAPPYCHWNAAGLPPADELSATPFEMAATYWPTLALNVVTPSPFGSQTRPNRGLKALSLTTGSPAPFTPLFLSQRRPRFSVRWLFARQLSLKKIP